MNKDFMKETSERKIKRLDTKLDMTLKTLLGKKG